MANLTDLIVNGAARIAGALHISSINPNPKSTNTGTVKIGTNSNIDGYNGILTLQPNAAKTSSTVGGELQLMANPNVTNKPGFAMEHFGSYMRIRGVPSEDGTSYTGIGTSIIIDPYNAAIGTSSINCTVYQQTAELSDYSTKKGANCSYVSRSHIYKKIQDLAEDQEVVQVFLNSKERCFYIEPTKDIQITFSPVQLYNTYEYDFELIVDMSAGAYNITWPANVVWPRRVTYIQYSQTPQLIPYYFVDTPIIQQGIYIFKFRNIKNMDKWLGSWELW